MSVADYLALEERSEIRHEYHDGWLLAMSGVAAKHADVMANLTAATVTHLRDGPCKSYQQAFKVRVEASNRFFYPDLVVMCDSLPGPEDHFTTTPKLVIEILSPSTEAFDRGEKFTHYGMVESLEEYVLVSTECQSVHVFQRKGPDVWRMVHSAAGGEVVLESIGLTLPMDTIYARTGVPKEREGAEKLTESS